MYAVVLLPFHVFILIPIYVQESGGARPIGTYYRVRFFGSPFRDLHGVQFIYREEKLARLVDIKDRMKVLCISLYLSYSLSVVKQKLVSCRNRRFMASCLARRTSLSSPTATVSTRRICKTALPMCKSPVWHRTLKSTNSSAARATTNASPISV